MKILMINQSDIGGGAEKIALTLCEQLNKKQIICDLYVDVKKSNSPNVHSLNRSNLNKKLSKIINKGLNQQSKFCGNTKYLELKLKEYDLVHIHNLHGNYLNLDIVKYISDLKIPIVWTLHDIWPITGRCCIEYSCTGFTRSCGECGSRLYSYPKMLLDNSSKVLEYKEKIITNSKITFVSPSIFIKELFLKSKFNHKPIYVINNGVDVENFKVDSKEILRSKYGLNKDKVYLLIIAAKLDNKEKGTSEAIEIINQIEDKTNIGIIVVGNGLEDSLFEDDIELINYGYIYDPKILAEIYTISDIFLNCTKADNFPTTNMESMISGTPVFASNIGGNLEQIDIKNGWIFDLSNLRNAANMLESIIRNKNEILQKSEICKAKAIKNYNLDRMTNDYINLYKKLIQNKTII